MSTSDRRRPSAVLRRERGRASDGRCRRARASPRTSESIEFARGRTASHRGARIRSISCISNSKTARLGLIVHRRVVVASRAVSRVVNRENHVRTTIARARCGGGGGWTRRRAAKEDGRRGAGSARVVRELANVAISSVERVSDDDEVADDDGDGDAGGDRGEGD